MNMSHTERLILSNQYEILAKLNPEKAAFYQRASTIVERGYCLQILELEKSFGHLDLATCQEVLDTLELHHALAISWGNLDAGTRAEVNESRLAFNGYSRARSGNWRIMSASCWRWTSASPNCPAPATSSPATSPCATSTSACWRPGVSAPVSTSSPSRRSARCWPPECEKGA